MSIRSPKYYVTYHGHEVDHLNKVHQELRKSHGHVVFLAGDSSLDNKAWVDSQKPALNGYENLLDPPKMKADIDYWMNFEAVERGASSFCCINTAIEATSLNDRACCLLAQDRFIRDNITENDYLVVSVGGNDIALVPVLLTIVNLLVLTYCVPQTCIEHCACGCPLNLHFDGGCFCCGVPGCITGTCSAWPPGLGYFVDMFKNRVQNYISSLVAKTKPKKVYVCMYYFLDEKCTGSWADGMLCCMCYNCFPSKLQAAIRAVYHLATEEIDIDGTEIVPIPLFEVLDGKDTKDFVQRVEPSVHGGRKMAVALMDAVLSEQRGRIETAPLLEQ